MNLSALIFPAEYRIPPWALRLLGNYAKYRLTKSKENRVNCEISIGYFEVLIFHIGEAALMYNRKRMIYSILLLWTTIKKTKDRLSSKKQVTSTGQGNIRGEYQRGMLIFCFAIVIGDCFRPRTPLLISKTAPGFSDTELLNIFPDKNKENRAMWKIITFNTFLCNRNQGAEQHMVDLQWPSCSNNRIIFK